MTSAQELSSFSPIEGFLLVLCLIISYVGASVIGHAIL